jgi:hypothetical protein
MGVGQTPAGNCAEIHGSTTARTIDAKNDRRCRRGTNHGQSRAEEASVREMETLSRRAGAKAIVSKESPPCFLPVIFFEEIT